MDVFGQMEASATTIINSSIVFWGYEDNAKMCTQKDEDNAKKSTLNFHAKYSVLGLPAQTLNEYAKR